MKKNKFVIIAILSLIVSSSLATGQINNSAGTAAFNPFEVAIGARQVGMGEAFSAMPNDIYSITYNPAALAMLTQSEITTYYNHWFTDAYQSFLAFGTPIRRDTLPYGVIGVGLNYFNQGKIEEYVNGAPTGAVLGAYDLGLIAGYSGLLQVNNYTIALGAGAKLIQRNLGGWVSSSICLDAGILAPGFLDDRLSFGLAVQNMGTRVKFRKESAPEPMNIIKFGTAFQQPISNWGGLNIAADIAWPNDDDLRYNLGAEIWGYDLLALRIGYRGGYDFDESKLTYGLGIVFRNFRLDYACVNYGDLGLTHRVSTTIQIGRPPKKVVVPPPTPPPTIIEDIDITGVYSSEGAGDHGTTIECSAITVWNTNKKNNPDTTDGPGNTNLDNLQITCTNLLDPAGRSIPSGNVSFAPATINYIKSGDTVKVVPKVIIPLYKDAGVYTGTITVKDDDGSPVATTELRVTVYASYDLDIADNRGGISNNTMRLLGNIGTTTPSEFELINPNLDILNVDPDSIGNATLRTLSYTVTDLVTRDDRDTISKNLISFERNPPALAYGGSEQVEVKFSIPMVRMPEERLVGPYYGKIIVGDDSSGVADSFTVIMDVMPTIYFDFAQDTIRNVDKAGLAEAANIIDAYYADKMIQIVGHTDTIGSDSANVRLSRRRANSVRQFLINQNVSPNILEIDPRGETETITDEAGPDKGLENRRVVLVVKPR